MCCRGRGNWCPLLIGEAGQLFGVGEQVAFCVPDLCGGNVGGDWNVLLRCKCVFLLYACAVGWVRYVFQEGGGGFR